MKTKKTENKRNLLIIDCENCANKLVEIMCSIKNTKIVLILGKAQHIEQYKIDTESVEVHQCLVINKNAADYVLVYELGRLFGTEEYERAFILSRDRDFANIADHLTLSGSEVYRVNFGASTDKTISVKQAINILSQSESGNSLHLIEKKLSMISIGGRVGACEALNVLNLVGLIDIRFTKTYQVFFNKGTIKELSSLL